MSTNSLKNKIINIIKKELKEKKIKINDGINTVKNWDSVGNFNLLLRIENDLKIKFSTNEFNSLNNFKSILKNVENKYKKRS